MFASSVAVLLFALAAVRFPDVPVLALLPAVLAASLAAVLPPDRGAWIGGLLAAALVSRLPGGYVLAAVIVLAPALVALARVWTTLHPVLIAAIALPLAAYLSAAAGSGSFAIPLSYPLHLCAAVAAGATLCAIAYAPTERERLGPRGRARLRIR